MPRVTNISLIFGTITTCLFFNSVNNNNCTMLCGEFRSSETVFINDMIISASEVQDIINNLSCGNYPGVDRNSSEHL